MPSERHLCCREKHLTNPEQTDIYGMCVCLFDSKTCDHVNYKCVCVYMCVIVKNIGTVFISECITEEKYKRAEDIAE